MKTGALLLLVVSVTVVESCIHSENYFQRGLANLVLPLSYHLCPPGELKLSDQEWDM